MRRRYRNMRARAVLAAVRKSSFDDGAHDCVWIRTVRAAAQRSTSIALGPARKNPSNSLIRRPVARRAAD